MLRNAEEALPDFGDVECRAAALRELLMEVIGLKRDPRSLDDHDQVWRRVVAQCDGIAIATAKLRERASDNLLF